MTIIASGIVVESAMTAAAMLKERGINAEVINIHTIKPIDSDIIVRSARKTGKVVTVEEHSVIGGLGSAVCEVLSEQCPTPVKRLGVPDVFGTSASASVLMHEFKLDGEGVCEQILDWMK